MLSFILFHKQERRIPQHFLQLTNQTSVHAADSALILGFQDVFSSIAHESLYKCCTHEPWDSQTGERTDEDVLDCVDACLEHDTFYCGYDNEADERSKGPSAQKLREEPNNYKLEAPD
jgi:hypothetical protein